VLPPWSYGGGGVTSVEPFAQVWILLTTQFLRKRIALRGSLRLRPHRKATPGFKASVDIHDSWMIHTLLFVPSVPGAALITAAKHAFAILFLAGDVYKRRGS
jgi:hypothetical protein